MRGGEPGPKTRGGELLPDLGRRIEATGYTDLTVNGNNSIQILEYQPI